MKFSEIIKELRKEKGLTQGELASFLVTSQRNISFYESGKTEPSIDMLIRMADFFDVDLDHLTGRSAG